MLALNKKSRRLLVVEDEPVLRRLLSKILSAAGEVVEAENGQVAWRLVRQEKFDAVISDISMPELSGLELLGLLRKHAIDIPFLFLSAHQTPEYEEEVTRLGARGILPKPFRREEVLRKLEGVFATGPGSGTNAAPSAEGPLAFVLDVQERELSLYLGQEQEPARLPESAVRDLREALARAPGPNFRALVEFSSPGGDPRFGEFVGKFESGFLPGRRASGWLIDQTERETFVRNHQRETHVLRDVLSNIPHSVFWKDKNSVYQGANARFLQNAGVVSEAEIIGKTDYEMPWTKEEADAYRRADAELMASGESRLNIEETQLQADGSEVHVVTSKVPLRDNEGRISGILGIYMDVTELRSVQRQVMAQETRLHAVAKMAALGEMASGIAHEINNPLAIIQAMAADLAEETARGAEAGAEVREGLAVIERTADRIAKIVTGLRAFSRNEKGADFRPAALEDILTDTLNFSQDRFRKSKVRLEVGELAGRTNVLCRSTEISQVLLNLLNNAVDAAAEGNDPWVRVGIRIEGDRAVVRVEDSGPGIAPENRAKILQPFFTTKGVGEGTGLGLSISLGIVQAHRGSLRLEEASAHTCFVVELPLG